MEKISFNFNKIGSNSKEKINKKELRKELFNKISSIFDRNSNGEDRIKEIFERWDCYLNNSEIFHNQNIKDEIFNLKNINDKECFVEELMKISEPILSFVENNPQEATKIIESRDKSIVRKYWNLDNNYKYAGKFISYGIDKNILHIHLPPSEDLIKDKGIGYFRREVLNDLKNLAEIIKENDEVKKITATSWIVKDHPEIFKKLGFSIGTENQKDEKHLYHSYISRDEFLERFL